MSLEIEHGFTQARLREYYVINVLKWQLFINGPVSRSSSSKASGIKFSFIWKTYKDFFQWHVCSMTLRQCQKMYYSWNGNLCKKREATFAADGGLEQLQMTLLSISVPSLFVRRFSECWWSIQGTACRREDCRSSAVNKALQTTTCT